MGLHPKWNAGDSRLLCSTWWHKRREIGVRGLQEGQQSHDASIQMGGRVRHIWWGGRDDCFWKISLLLWRVHRIKQIPPKSQTCDVLAHQYFLCLSQCFSAQRHSVQIKTSYKSLCSNCEQAIVETSASYIYVDSRDQTYRLNSYIHIERKDRNDPRCVPSEQSVMPEINRRETCYESGETPAQSRAGLFPSAAPEWTPWGLRAPSSPVSPPPEQPALRLVSAAPPPEPGWAKRGARPEQPSDPWCSEPTALWQTHCLPGDESHKWLSAFTDNFMSGCTSNNWKLCWRSKNK